MSTDELRAVMARVRQDVEEAKARDAESVEEQASYDYYWDGPGPDDDPEPAVMVMEL